MACCALLSLLIATAFWLAARVTPHRARAIRDPLAWRLHAPPAGVRSGCAEERPHFSLSARLRSFAFAADGIRFMLKNEHNARIHLVATIIVVAAGLALEIRQTDWRWIAGVILWVWFAEALNTAFEHVCDVVSPGRNEAVRVAKDVAAGAVLISAVGAALIGTVTLAPYFAALIAPPAAGFDFVSALCRYDP